MKVGWVRPARCWSFFDRVTDETLYRSLGPFAAGDLLAGVWIYYACPADAVLDLAMALGGSEQANAASLDAGHGLLDWSDAHGVPGAANFHVGSGSFQYGQVFLPVGRRIGTGAQWVIVGYRMINTGDVMVAVERKEEEVIDEPVVVGVSE